MAKRKRKSKDDSLSAKPPRTVQRVQAPRVTRSMTTDAARRAVLDTTELLENVLIYLPPRRLFTIQRVCRQFKNTIKKSTQLQTKMFSRSRESKEKQEKWTLVGDFYASRFVTGDMAKKVPEPRLVYNVARANVALFSKIHNSCGTLLSTRGTRLQFHDSMMKFIKLFMKGHCQAWEHVYLTDPPCTEAKMRIDIRVGDYDRGVVFYGLETRHRDDSGFTMGGLIRSWLTSRDLSGLKVFGPSAGEFSRNLTNQERIAKAEEMFESEAFLENPSHVLVPDVVIPTDQMRAEIAKDQATSWI